MPVRKHLDRDLNSRTARLIIGVSAACNLHCKFCVFGDKRNEFIELSSQDILAALSDYAKVCDRVGFTGGEPTLRKDLPVLIRTAKSLGYEVSVQSNGRMYAYKEFCQRLIQAGVDYFGISLSAHSARLYNELSRTKGGFSQVVAGIINLVSLRQEVNTITVINVYNVIFLEKIAMLLVRLGVRGGQLSLVREIPDSDGIFREGYFTRNSINKALKYLFKAADILHKAGVVVRIRMIPPCYLPGYESYYGKYLGTTENIIIVPRTRDNKPLHINIGNQIRFCKADGCNSCIYDSSCEGIAEFTPFEPMPVLKKVM